MLLLLSCLLLSSAPAEPPAPDFGPRPAWVDKGAFTDADGVYAVGVVELDLLGAGCGKPNLMLSAAENRGRAEIQRFLAGHSVQAGAGARVTTAHGRSTARGVRAWFDGKTRAYVLVRDQLGEPAAAAGVDVSQGKSSIEVDVLVRQAAWAQTMAKGLCADPATRGEHCCGDPTRWCDDPTRFNRVAGEQCYCGTSPPCGAAMRCVGAGMNGGCKPEAYGAVPGQPWRVVAELGDALNAVHGSAPDDVWVVGGRGAALRFDGKTWRYVATGVSTDLLAVWAAGKKDAWAAGAGGILLHWDGAAWRDAKSGVSADLRALWGRGAGDVWVAGAGGTVLRWQGREWSRVPTPGSQALESIWGDGAHVYVGGESGLMVDGASGLSPVADSGLPSIRAIGGGGAAGVWVAGDAAAALWDGKGCVRTDRPARTAGLAGRSATDVWAVGPDGAVHFDGTAWGTAWGGCGLTKVWIDPRGSGWAVGPRCLARYAP